MIKESGSVFLIDDYQQQYEVDWETVGGDIDITTVVKMPYIWGEESKGFVKNGILFRQGTISVKRQIIRINDEGYEIIAEGSSSFNDLIQMNYSCEKGPTDPFKYHVDCGHSDEIEVKVVEGPHWADPDDPDDADVIWDELNVDGTPVSENPTTVTTGPSDILSWIDVWDN